MEISGDSYGCNADPGPFEVKDIATAGRRGTRVWIVYEQHCEGQRPGSVGRDQDRRAGLGRRPRSNGGPLAHARAREPGNARSCRADGVRRSRDDHRGDPHRCERSRFPDPRGRMHREGTCGRQRLSGLGSFPAGLDGHAPRHTPRHRQRRRRPRRHTSGIRARRHDCRLVFGATRATSSVKERRTPTPPRTPRPTSTAGTVTSRSRSTATTATRGTQISLPRRETLSSLERHIRTRRPTAGGRTARRPSSTSRETTVAATRSAARSPSSRLPSRRTAR